MVVGVVVVHREWVARENGATPVVARGGSYWLNHGVLAMAVVLVACVEL